MTIIWCYCCRFALSSSDVLDIAGSLVPSLYSANADAYSDLIILPTKLFDVLVNQPDFFTQLLESTDTDEDEGLTRGIGSFFDAGLLDNVSHSFTYSSHVRSHERLPSSSHSRERTHTFSCVQALFVFRK